FDEATVQRWADHYLALVGQWLEDASVQPAAMRLLDDAGCHRFLASTRCEPQPIPVEHTLHGWIEHRAAQAPEALAVLAPGCAMRYADLNEAANALAWQLLDRGIRVEDRVAILAERGPEQIVAILAVWKAGGAYVPLDLGYPDDRLRYMLQDSAPMAVLCGKGLAARAGTLAPSAALIDLTSMPAGSSRGNPRVAGLDVEALAYVIYTSGSTGRPKGVMVEHRCVLNLWADLERQVLGDLPADARVGLNGSLSFDASVQSLIQLLSGRCLVVIPQWVRQDAAAMVAYLREHRVRAFDCTPSHLEGLLAAGLLDQPDYHADAVLVGGEAIVGKLWQHLAQDERCRYFNVYGPTECTVDATLTRIRAVDTPHIGRPVANTQVYIVDRFGQVVPPGQVGEIWIGGAGVGRGYLNQPELTQGRFIADPFQPDREARVYRTGDLGRWRGDGSIDYLGRNDFQVKVRGYRIELGEIEAQLCACPGVRDAVVLVREDVPGDPRLVAYFRTDGSRPLQVADLRDWLTARLADFMVPAAMVRVEDWPLTPNGKLDRPVLPAPDDASYGQRDFEAPEAGLETALAGVWQEVLRVPRVGRRDSFFALGGHSLLAMQLVARVREQLQA
ncbi:non-ribosomal peptide synthetase, partial [Frateuria sp. Soil773]|uniref:non-ribosomal peptide synthetase n=1 Tax=Frateuria sp. Soil773 TaxID=1736407 RepID=UPI000AE9E780